MKKVSSALGLALTIMLPIGIGIMVYRDFQYSSIGFEDDPNQYWPVLAVSFNIIALAVWAYVRIVRNTALVEERMRLFDQAQEFRKAENWEEYLRVLAAYRSKP